MTSNAMWLAVGFLGQGLFSLRFIMQWMHSERLRKSVIPVVFWYFSLAGGTTLFVYAIYREDPVFIVGQGLGLIIYLRNLYFIRKSGQSPAQPVADKNGLDNP